MSEEGRLRGKERERVLGGPCSECGAHGGTQSRHPEIVT